MSYLISKQGKKIDCAGIEHSEVCRIQLRQSLKTFLNSGGCRVKIHLELMAVETSKKLTVRQVGIINDLLAEYPIFTLVSDVAGVYKENKQFRQIRGFKNA